MTSSLVPAAPRVEPKGVVLGFFEALHDFDHETLVGLVDDHIDYVNVTATRVRGKKAFAWIFAFFFSLSGGAFDVVFLNIAQDGDIVLTERLDTLKLGPVWIQFWVLGRLEVKNGKITVWRDYFDYLNFTLGTFRGLVGAVIPALRPKNTHRLPF